MILALLSSAASGGVWVNAPGAGYAQMSYTHQQADTFFGEDGRAVPQTALLQENSALFSRGRYSSSEGGVYLEYGLLRGIELVASLPYRSATNRWTFAEGPFEDIRHTNHGAGDLTAGLRAGVVGGGYALSGLVAGRAPLYDNSPEVLGMEPGRSNFFDDRVPLGQGTMELDIGAGGGISSGRFWALLDAAVRLRDRQYSSALPARLQLGLKPVDALAAWISIDSQLPLINGAAPDFFADTYGNGPLIVDRQRWLTPSLGFALEPVQGYGVTASVGRTLAGARFPRLTTVSIGLYSRFRMPWADGGLR